MFTFRKSKTKSKNLLLSQKRDDKRYESEKELTQSDKISDRMKLAKSEETHKEILYYLAENDENENVRKAVAKNLMTPVQASEVIAKDKSIDVRLALLKRLCHLLPDLQADEYAHLYAHAVQALSVLALDEVLKVRKALASALKDKAYCPPKIATQLAKDVEREVSEPILKYCVAIPDMDLIDILKHAKHEWVARAIAQREQIKEPVSRGVVDRSDFPKAGEDLLNNKSAEINSETYDYIIEKAKELPEWQEPLAFRKDLPMDMLKTIASFVNRKIRAKMLKEHDFDDVTKDEIEETVKRRINFLKDKDGQPITPSQKLKKLIDDNRLDEDAILDAIALRETSFVVKALAHLAKIKAQTAQKIFVTKVPKAIVALSWRAGLSMRFAVKLQTEFAKVPHTDVLYAKSGEQYPLSEDAMLFQLDYFEDA